MIIKKYIFSDEQKANELIDALGVDTNTNVVKLGNIILNKSEFDEQGNEIKAPILSDKYHVDVCWVDENDSNISNWSKYEIILDNEGVHSFFGLKYIHD
ncbi:MAG: hypothetical protein Unbinned5434contig1000_35 [Prokaryotic dsDNA virus sp.]|jgi:hypothetical protein|nr:MAG: hypothetical protein Unbinned5434contig1000_35 [Prokaryotic dsDNA virus sp.]|tara:strand:- start:208 stop:504 length:297 start_codon:yes stop_codon:yes gene_type:complete